MSTGANQPFRPAGTAAAAASTAVTNVALNGGGGAVLIYNAAAATAFFRLGGASGLSAAVSDTPVPAGARMLVDAGPFVSNAAVVLSSGTGTVYFTLGDGDTY
jgi:hypothetical protein